MDNDVQLAALQQLEIIAFSSNSSMRTGATYQAGLFKFIVQFPWRTWNTLYYTYDILSGNS
jgi:hypothetical protein